MTDQSKNKPIPEQFHSLFWDLDLDTIDIIAHRDFIMGRIMELGSWNSMKWLRKTYSKDQILSYLNNRGKRILPFRELNYWLFIVGISSKKRDKLLKEVSESDYVWRNRYSH